VPARTVVDRSLRSGRVIVPGDERDDMTTATRHAAQYGDPLDNLRHQLSEARSRLEVTRAANDDRGAEYWEAIIEQIVQRRPGLADEESEPRSWFDRDGRSAPPQPADMTAFIRRQLLGR
jgi:hypothetical protein